MPIIIQLKEDIPSIIVDKLTAIGKAAISSQTAIDNLQKKISGFGSNSVSKVSSDTDKAALAQEKLNLSLAKTSTQQEILSTQTAKTRTQYEVLATQTAKTFQETERYSQTLRASEIVQNQVGISAAKLGSAIAQSSAEKNKALILEQKLNDARQQSIIVANSVGEASVLAAEKEVQAKAKSAQVTASANNEKQRSTVIDAQRLVQEQRILEVEARTDLVIERRKVAAEALSTQQQRTFTAITNTQIASERLTMATNAAAASFNTASSAAINEENNLAKLNITLANAAIAQKNARDAGGIARTAVTQDFQPQRDSLRTNVQALQQTLSLEQQLALYRVQNEGATLSEIRAENALYAAMAQGLTVMQRLGQGEANLEISRSRATVAAISEAEAIAKLNIVEAEAAIAAQRAIEAKATPNLSNSATFDNQRASIASVVQAKQQALATDQALASQAVITGQATLEHIQVEAQLAQALAQTAQATQQVVQGELALVAVQAQAVGGAISQQQSLTQLNIAEVQLAESIKRARDAKAIIPPLSSAAAFEADRQALQKVTEQAKLDAQARIDLTNQQIKSGQITEADIHLQLRMAEALARVARAANVAAHEELDLNIKREQSAQNAIKTQVDQIRLDQLKTGANSAKKAVQELGESFHVSAGVAREVFVITREILTGSTTLLGGSLIVLSNRLGLASGFIKALLSPAESLIKVFDSAAVKAARLAEATAKIAEEKAAADALAAAGGAAVSTEISMAALLATTAAILIPFAALGSVLYARNSQFKEFNTTLFLTNNVLGLTQKGFNDLAEKIAQGSGISVKETTETLTELARSGKFTSTILADLTKDIGKFSIVTNKSIEETTKDFIQAFGGGADSILKFNEQFHFLTGANQAYIATHTSFIDAAEAQRRALKDIADYIEKYKIQVENTTTAFGKLTKSFSDGFHFFVNYDLTPTIDYFNGLGESIEKAYIEYGKFIQLFLVGDSKAEFLAKNKEIVEALNRENIFGFAEKKQPQEVTNAPTTRSENIVPKGSLAAQYAQQQSIKGGSVPTLPGATQQKLEENIESINKFNEAMKETVQLSVDAKKPPLFGEGLQKEILTTVEIANRAKDAFADVRKAIINLNQDNGTGNSFKRIQAREEYFKKEEAIRRGIAQGENLTLPTPQEREALLNEIDRQNPIRLTDKQKAEQLLSNEYDKQLSTLKDQLSASKFNTEERRRQLALAKLLDSAPVAQVDGKKVKLEYSPERKAALTEVFNKVQDKLPVEKLLDKIDKKQLEPLREIEVAQKAYNISLEKYPQLAEYVLQYTEQLKEKQANLLDPLRETNIQRGHELDLLKLSGTELEVQTRLLKDEDTLRKGGIKGIELENRLLSDQITLKNLVHTEQVSTARRGLDPTAKKEQNTASIEAVNELRQEGKISVEDQVIELGKLQTAKEELDLQYADTSSLEAFIIGLDRATRKTQTDNQTLAKSTEDFARGAVKGFADSAAQALVTGKSFSESFKGVILNLIVQLESSLIQLEIQSLITGRSIQALALTGGGGGGGGGLLGTLIGAAASILGGGASYIPYASTAFEASSGLTYSLPGTAFASGGYTGDDPTDQVTGHVHGQEYVVNAAATSRNRATLETLNATGSLPQQSGGSQDNRPWVIENHTTGRVDKVRVQMTPNEKRLLIEEITDQWGDSASPMARKFSRSYSNITRNR